MFEQSLLLNNLIKRTKLQKIHNILVHIRNTTFTVTSIVALCHLPIEKYVNFVFIVRRIELL